MEHPSSGLKPRIQARRLHLTPVLDGPATQAFLQELPVTKAGSAINELFSVEGKTALVTGGSRGIGKMIASGFAAAGAKVYISSRDGDACARAASELSVTGTCFAIRADLRTEAACHRLAEDLCKREAALDILVNNAGATWGAPLAEHDEESFERVLSLNVKALFYMIKFLTPLLQAGSSAQDPARIINIGSIDGLHTPDMETYSYSASKAAVHHLTRHLAKRLAPTITVNAIAPGPFESKMMAATLAAHGNEIAASAPLRRIGRTEDMAGAAIFLSSRAASYITGSVLPVDGGIATLR